MAELGKADGWVNLARVYQREGRIPDALEALEKAAAHPKPAAPWVINWLTGQINERNGLLDEAIASYESVLATRIPDRGFDFSRDYEVINALGTVLYARARQEPRESPARRDFLRRAIAAYRRTLAIDTENVAAHYGLGLAYADLAARGRARQPRRPRGTSPAAGRPDRPRRSSPARSGRRAPSVDPKFASRRGHSSSPRRSREFVERPRPEFGSRLEPLHEVVERLGPAWDAETDPAAQAALARALEVTHKALHATAQARRDRRGPRRGRSPGATTRPPTRTPSRS